MALLRSRTCENLVLKVCFIYPEEDKRHGAQKKAVAYYFEERTEASQIVENGHSLTEWEERLVLNYKTSPCGRSIQILDGGMDPSGSKQTAESIAAENQANNKIRMTAEHLTTTKILSKGGSKDPRTKGYKGARNVCLKTKMFERLRYPMLLSELSFLCHSA